MSASLATQAVSPLLALTAPKPTSADLRARAVFWRAYAMRAPQALSTATYCAVLDNCDAMEAAAKRMEQAAKVVKLVPAAARQAPSTLGAEQFWTLHSDAVRAIVTAHGLSWRNNVPQETIEVTLPARLCSYVGPLGGRIKWRRDHRMPAPRYWPGGHLPAGVEALPVPERYTGPMGDMHPSLVMIREAIAESGMQRRIKAGRAAIVAYWKGQARSAVPNGYRVKRTRAQRAVGMRTVAECRRSMAAELARLAEIQAFSPAFPPMTLKASRH